MLEILQRQFKEKQDQHNEILENYNKKVAEREKLDDEIERMESDLIFLRGALKALDDVGVIVIEDEKKAKTESTPVNDGPYSTVIDEVER